MWISVEAQRNGPGTEWERCLITDPPVIEEVTEERAAKMEAIFKKKFPIGRYVQILDLTSKTRHWVFENWIRIPEASKKKKRKKVPPKLAEFTEKLQEVSAQAKEEKEKKESERGLSSKPPDHVLAKRKRSKRRK